MTSILDVRRYPEARDGFRWDALWDLVDGDRERLNLAHECVDRHVGKGTALRIQFADGHREEHDFGALAEWLRENLWRYGRKYMPRELIERITGGGLDPEPYLRYLRGKYPLAS